MSYNLLVRLISEDFVWLSEFLILSFTSFWLFFSNFIYLLNSLLCFDGFSSFYSTFFVFIVFIMAFINIFCKLPKYINTCYFKVTILWSSYLQSVPFTISVLEEAYCIFTFMFLWRYLGILGYYTLVFLCKYLVLSLLGECSILWSCFLNMGLAICSSYENYLAKSNSVGT